MTSRFVFVFLFNLRSWMSDGWFTFNSRCWCYIASELRTCAALQLLLWQEFPVTDVEITRFWSTCWYAMNLQSRMFCHTERALRTARYTHLNTAWDLIIASYKDGFINKMELRVWRVAFIESLCWTPFRFWSITAWSLSAKLVITKIFGVYTLLTFTARLLHIGSWCERRFCFELRISEGEYEWIIKMCWLLCIECATCRGSLRCEIFCIAFGYRRLYVCILKASAGVSSVMDSHLILVCNTRQYLEKIVQNGNVRKEFDSSESCWFVT